MRPWERWIALIAILAVTFVAVSSIALAIRQASWSPLFSVGWLPAVLVAIWPGAHRRCITGRGRQAR
jgi:predicted Na+-dependent transporter